LLSTFKYYILYIYNVLQTPSLPLSNSIFSNIYNTSNIIPKLDNCNMLLIQQPLLPWTHLLFNTLARLPNQPERLIHIPHSIQKNLSNDHDIIYPIINIYEKLFKFIHNQNEPPIIQIMQTNSLTYHNHLLLKSYGA
jgi:hypothetical protein